VAGYSRYVAIGDSQTEGLWDGDDSVGLTGFADRLAMHIDSHFPGLAYANLAVRGRRILDLLVEQLPHALAMRPDLITVCIGMNDVTRPGPYFDAPSPISIPCTRGWPDPARRS
jgi:lysophospholipase L1-like esterase